MKQQYIWTRPGCKMYFINAGGTYSPVHKGHYENWILAIQKVCSLTGAEVHQVNLIVMPVGDNAKAKDGRLPFDTRVKLLHALINECNPDRLYNIEVDIINQEEKQLMPWEERDRTICLNEADIRNVFVLSGADNIKNMLNATGWNLNDDDKWNLLHDTTFLASCETGTKSEAGSQRGGCTEIETLFTSKTATFDVRMHKSEKLNTTLIVFEHSNTAISSSKIRKLFRELLSMEKPVFLMWATNEGKRSQKTIRTKDMLTEKIKSYVGDNVYNILLNYYQDEKK